MIILPVSGGIIGTVGLAMFMWVLHRAFELKIEGNSYRMLPWMKSAVSRHG